MKEKFCFKFVKTYSFPNREVLKVNLSGNMFQYIIVRFVAASWYMCQVYDIITGKIIASLKELEGDINCLCFNNELGDCVAISQDNNVVLLDISARKTQALIGHQAEVHRIQFDPYSQFVATCSDDATARLWDFQIGKQIQIYLGHKSGILNLHFNSDGDKLITCSQDHTARIWDVRSGNCIHILNEHKDYVFQSQFDTTGNYCATGSDDFTCKIWDVKTGKCIKTLKGHQGGIINISFNIDGTRIVTTSEDFAGRIFNVKTGECVSQLLDSCNFGNKLQYLLPKNLIISECSDSSPRIYSETGELLQVLQIGGGTQFCYSPNFDGVIVVVSQGDNPRLEVWKDIQN